MIVFDHHRDVCAWASNIIFDEYDAWDEKARAISVVNDGEIIAAVIYHNYQPRVSIDMSIASIDKRWATRHNLKAFFKYPFIELGLKRVSTLCSANDRDLIMFNKRLGFTPEGYHRSAHFDGSDSVSFGMLRKECRWL